MIVPLLVLGGSDGFRAALDFTSGVLSLVSLTASIGWGLIATDRLLLSTRHRLLAQGIHRATAVAALGFLLLHGTVKVALGHVEPLGAFLPFGLGVTGTSALIGFGSLAGLLMVVTAATGALRSTLAGRSRFAARWRPLHMLAYPAWCFALIHGLYAGRPAATWVLVLYCLALAAVAAAVSLRLLPAPTQRALADRFAGLMASLEGRTRPPEPDGGDFPDNGESTASPSAAPVHDEPTTVSAEWLDRPSPGVPAGFAAAYRAVSRAAPEPPARTPERPTRTPAPPSYAPEPAGHAHAHARYAAEPLPHPSEPAPYVPDGVPYAAEDVTTPLAERVPLTEEIPVVPDPPVRPGFWPAPSPAMPTYATPPPMPTYNSPPSTPTYSSPPSTPTYGSPPSMPTYAAPPPAPPYATPPPAGEPWTAPSGDRP
ncbi:hypothetical protein ACIPPS_22645 [Streptomyces sp. NPDC090127]|uniref:hypothetical protein n=1 Tax=Streptomyces sp. NPDC090127 TaxID=3365953 RepID=UPI00382EFA4E